MLDSSRYGRGGVHLYQFYCLAKLFLSDGVSYAFQGKQLAQLLDEDPAVMERRQQCAKRLELYKAARDEIDSVSWAR